MSVNIGSKIVLGNSVPSIDEKYGPYVSTQAAWERLGEDDLDCICIGLTVGIQPTASSPVVEYWFKDGVEFSNLVPKYPAELPNGGSTGQVLKKTAGGVEWANESGGSGITGITMNQSAVTVTGGVADLGTVITSHQDISGKQDKSTLETDVATLGFTKNAGTLMGVTMNGSPVSVSEGVANLGTVITDVSGKQDALTTSSVSDGTIDKSIGFDSNGNLVKDTVSDSGITGITMNESAVAVTEGVANLGTVITSHQDISGKQDKSTLETDVATLGFTKNAGTVTDVTVGGTSVITSGVAQIPAIPDAVSGTNDGTNWTTLTVGSVTKNIPQGGGSSTDTNQTIAADANGSTVTFGSDAQVKLTSNEDIVLTPNNSTNIINIALGTVYADQIAYERPEEPAAVIGGGEGLDEPIGPATEGEPVTDTTVTVYDAIADQQNTIENIGTKVDTLVDTVGDNNSGLVADVNTLKSSVGNQPQGESSSLWAYVGDLGLAGEIAALSEAIGDSSSGLTKDVDTLLDVVGDSSSGLIKDVTDIQTVTSPLSNVVSARSTSGNYGKFIQNNNGTLVWGAASTPTLANLVFSKGNTNLFTYNPADEAVSFDLYSQVDITDGIAGLDSAGKIITSKLYTDTANNPVTLDAGAKVPMNKLYTEPGTGNVVVYDANSKIPTNSLYINEVNGVAPLNESGVLPVNKLPNNIPISNLDTIQSGNISNNVKQEIVGGVFSTKGQVLVGAGNSTFKTLSLGTNGQLLTISNGDVVWANAPQAVSIEAATGSGLTVSETNGVYSVGISSNNKLLRQTEYNDLVNNKVGRSELDSLVGQAGYSKTKGTITGINVTAGTGLKITGSKVTSGEGSFTVDIAPGYTLPASGQWPPKTVQAIHYADTSGSPAADPVELTFVYCDTDEILNSIPTKYANTIYIVGKNAQVATLNAPTIAWGASYASITWDKVNVSGSGSPEVTGYEIYKDDILLDTISGSGESSYSYTDDIIADKAYTVKCYYANSGSGTVWSNASNMLKIVSNSYKPSNVRTQTTTNYTLIWDRVDDNNIQKYQVFVDDLYLADVPQTSSGITPTYIGDSAVDLSNSKSYEVRSVLNEIKEIFSTKSEPCSISLAAPTLSIDDDGLSWTNIPAGATHIQIFNSRTNTQVGTDLPTSTTSYKEITSNTYYIVHAIQQIAGATKFIGANSSEVSIEQINAPTIRFNTENDEGTITWDAVTGATEYIVSVNDVEQEPQTSNTFTTGINANGTGKTYKVKAIKTISGGSTLESGWSNSLTTNPCAITIGIDPTDQAYSTANISYHLGSYVGQIISMPYYVIKGTPSVDIYCTIGSEYYSFPVTGADLKNSVSGIDTNAVAWVRGDAS